MNHAIRFLSIFLGVVGIAHAVPTAINYQGRLTDGDGNPASGSKLFSLSLYDAATAGNELYAETIGSIAVDDNGIYNFQFGANGTSVVWSSEDFDGTDGTAQVFNGVLSNSPVDGSVSITDGTYTWSQSDGSSASPEFLGSVTIATRAVSAIYISEAPESGRSISAAYNYLESGIFGGLNSESALWLELTIDGSIQSPRERVLSVPYAQYSKFSESLLPKPKLQKTKRIGGFASLEGSDASQYFFLPKLHTSDAGANTSFIGYYQLNLPEGVVITGLTAPMSETRKYSTSPFGKAEVILGYYDYSGFNDMVALVTDQEVKKTYTENFSLTVDSSRTYYIMIRLGPDANTTSGGGAIDWVDVAWEE